MIKSFNFNDILCYNLSLAGSHELFVRVATRQCDFTEKRDDDNNDNNSNNGRGTNIQVSDNQPDYN